MSKLVCADPHFDDSVRNEYRWELFPWLKKQALATKSDTLYIVGDICDRKNNHSDKLVNRVIDSFIELSEVFVEIRIIKGNHDYDKDDATPFFKFMGEIDRLYYVNESFAIGRELFLPHTRNPSKDWKDINFNDYKIVYMHQMVKGSKVHDSYCIEEGYDPNQFKKYKNTLFISGDNHIPQSIGDNFIYVGAPYPVKFGDDYMSRILHIPSIEENPIQTISILHRSIAKKSCKIKKIGDLNNCDWRKGDHAKVEINLSRSEFHEYPAIRKQVNIFCKVNNIELFSVELKPLKDKGIKMKNPKKKLTNPSQILKEFSDKEKIGDELLKVGEELL